MEFSHISVMPNEVIELLNIRDNGIYVDGTAGGAGHSKLIAGRLNTGHLYAIDRDPDAVAVATERLASYPATVIEGNFSDMVSLLGEKGITRVDGILLDLGVSSFQLDNGERGFSYKQQGNLDMRMSKAGLSAGDVISSCDYTTLRDIFYKYGEEKFAPVIAKKIIAYRDTAPITTTIQLADIISEAVPASYRRSGNPARKCFQALRIYVNNEIDMLSNALTNCAGMLNEGGVLAVITFHSLEDRITKNTFKELCRGCICPPDIPVCVCGRKPQYEPCTKKAILPSQEETESNKRSRSAKLRAIRKL